MAFCHSERFHQWIILTISIILIELIKNCLTVSPTPYMLPVLTTVPKMSNQILETVMIPIADSESEANKLYEENLKRFGIKEKLSKRICPPWELKGCQCTDKEQDETIELSCRGTIFTDFHSIKWPRMIVKLQLSNNNITMLPNRSFDLPHLNELIISYNSIQTIEADAFVGLKSINRLIMNNCDLKVFPGNALNRIPGLIFLQLNGNSINFFETDSLVNFKKLKNLYLEGNSITKIPTKTLAELVSLETLNLGGNQLRNIEIGDFPVMKNLVVLLMKRNHLTEIPSGSLLNLTSLNVINLDDNQLTSLPPDLVKLSHLQELFVSGNRIKFILKDDLPKSLTIIEMKSNPLNEFKNDSMINMTKLKKLTLSNSRNLEYLPLFDGCESLEILWVDRSKLKELPNNLCQTSPKLKTLELKSNRLKTVPVLTGCKQLRLLDLADNHIDTLHGKPFQSLIFLQDLLLSNNQIATIPYDTFTNLTSLQLLDLEGNDINFIHKDAFVALTQLKDLNLGNNIFPDLPTSGLNSLNHLKTFNNPRLKDFPTTESFPKIETLVLSYAYHCCAFLPLKVRAESRIATVTETILPLPDGVNFSSLFNDSSIREIMQRNGIEYPTYYGTIPTYEEYNEVEVTRSMKTETLSVSIRCLPLPDPFLPCQDLFDWWTLRCGVWVVFLLAMLGNGTVVFVLIFSRSKMDVPRFLVCNLAAADFFMGIYLGLLAVVDASTLGEFRMYAIPWQMSTGCQCAGFLAVLSSELSVYTLAVITLERNYAITHAMHLNKRLSLRHAAYIMTIGWIFALTMAMLPLFGISDYRKFAVCLPFETTTGPSSLAYVIFLMFINGVAFLILMGCYLKMYCAIRGSQAWNSNDSRIAKRMALLVFTDFLCWSPIAFFSLTAVFGVHLISLEQAKVFTVFVLPLNSCCNPFLYAILTKQFKKDCVLICKAIEESRVTRGIGRCRHSSNFSNRQTPANTNSLVERSSRDLPPLLPGQTCACAKLLEQDKSHRHISQPSGGFSKAWRRLLCHAKENDTRRGKRSDQYAHQIAEIQQKQHKRAGSMSSSENFSSSRSDSWRHGPPHHYCGIQLRKLDPRWRHSSWLITRKTSQDSNLSSSRNDSSGSATTASTSTWRMSRSSTPLPPCGASFNTSIARQSLPGSKPRLVRQSAIQDDSLDLSSSPPRLGVRFLPTIPSAADSSVQLDEETVTNNDDEEEEEEDDEEEEEEEEHINCDVNVASNSGNGSSSGSGIVNNNSVGGTQYYAILQSGNPLTTLSSPKDTKPP